MYYVESLKNYEYDFYISLDEKGVNDGAIIFNMALTTHKDKIFWDSFFKWFFIKDINTLYNIFLKISSNGVFDDESTKKIKQYIEKTKINMTPADRIIDIINGGPPSIEQPKEIYGQLYPHQLSAIEFLELNGGRGIIADTMGLGKTATSIGFLKRSGSKKAIIVSPALVKFSWSDEIKKWTGEESLVIDSKTKDDLILHNDFKYLIINYDILKKKFSVLSRVRPDTIIFDEMHYLKNSKAQRTRAALALAKPIKQLVLLSGTPFLSRPIELFNALQLLNPQEWRSWLDYAKRYCNYRKTRFGIDVSGASNIDELRDRIKFVMLRRTKEQVLKDLPPKIYTNIPVVMSSQYKYDYGLIMKEYKMSKKADDMASKLKLLNGLRVVTSKGKIDAAIDLIKRILSDPNEKVVVFSVYNSPLEEIAKEFGDESVMITGKTLVKDRGAIVNSFQNNKNVRVFLGGLVAAGVGITLTAASNVVFLDFSWVPADHMQAADRVHRISQKANSVNIYQLYAKDTIDEFLVNMLKHKQYLFNKLIEGGKEAASLAVTNELISLLLK